MKTTIKTSVLKSMMSKVIKGVANNKMLPVTSLIGIEKEDMDKELANFEL